MRGLSEPVSIMDVFACGLAKIEKIGGGCVRLYLYVVQAPLDGDGPQEKQVVTKIILPISALSDAALLLAQAAHDPDGVTTALAPDMVH